MSCVNPHSLKKLKVKIVFKHFANIVHSLTKQKMCFNTEGDANIDQFRTLKNCQMNAFEFKSFKQSQDRLDQFYLETLEAPTKSSL